MRRPKKSPHIFIYPYFCMSEEGSENYFFSLANVSFIRFKASTRFSSEVA